MRLIHEEKAFIREAVLLMLPMILQNFVTFSMSMADTFMVGVLGETALAAVTMANSPFYVMQLMIFGVLRGGGDVRYAMLCDVGPLYAVCLPLAALAALVWKLDIRDVYPLMSIEVIVQLFLVIPRLRSGKWIHDVTRSAGELEA